MYFIYWYSGLFRLGDLCIRPRIAYKKTLAYL